MTHAKGETGHHTGGAATGGAERRRSPRHPAPKSLALTCRVKEGPVKFEGLIVDLGPGGLGAIVYDADVKLEVGMLLPRVEIEFPGLSPVLSSIEVRHVGSVTRNGGVVAKRAGCRFIAPGSAIDALMRKFLDIGRKSAG